MPIVNFVEAYGWIGMVILQDKVTLPTMMRITYA